jgi:3,4-dihydroxy-2-butanone 4-phosphate synthase
MQMNDGVLERSGLDEETSMLARIAALGFATVVAEELGMEESA